MRVGIKKVLGTAVAVLLISVLGIAGIYFLCFILDALFRIIY